MTLRLFVPRDAAAVAVGADELVAALATASKKAAAKAEIIRNGSRGMLWLEPLLEVEHEGVRWGFGPLEAADVASLAKAGLFSGKPPASIKHPRAVGPVEEVPYFRRQTRLTFARCGVTDPVSLDDYRAHGGYQGLDRALELSPAGVVDEVAKSGLRGRGGAGFPTGIKWKTVHDTPGSQKYIVCNADEGDSGTFADRMIMEGDPFVLIEGMTIAGIAVGATKGYIYLRSEYPHAEVALNEAIQAARQAGFLGPKVAGSKHAFELEVRMGAGAYVCGEETSLLESLEGKRGVVRAKPPLPAHKGLFARPTVINNVLSFAAVPFILAEGAKAYADYGMGRSRGTMPIQLAGNIKHGGLFETAFGVTLGELVDDIGGGTASGRPVRAVQVGGPLGAYFPARALRYALRLRSLHRKGWPHRSWWRRGLRRHCRHGEPGSLRLRVLRHRKLRQVHAVPDRRDARQGDGREGHGRRAGRCQPRPHQGSVQHYEVRFPLRSGWVHPISGHERADAFPGRFQADCETCCGGVRTHDAY